ncbi:MAG: hypothetical protein GY746_10805 [Gammaproteobacteria bacterium]|nr:hypothetical protein [Gammaproteobacteria bacterium]
MTISVIIPTNATDEVVEAKSRAYINTVTLAPNPTGTVTGGTLTVQCMADGAADFEDISPNTIDLASPQRLEIQGKVGKYSFSVSGFAGTATELYIGLDTDGA